MRRPTLRLSRLPIRSRLALLVTVAVACAVAVVSVTCWFVVRGKLYAEIDDDLRGSNLSLSVGQIRDALTDCAQSVDDDRPFGPQPQAYVELVTADGEHCVFDGSAGAVRATAGDVAVADGTSTEPHFRSARATDGKSVRTVTFPLRIEGVAVLVGLPLGDTERTLDELALLLLLVSGVGALGAGAAGLAVARSGLRPVDELTQAVEHVARTEDLAVRIPVDDEGDDEGDDEIARLSRSFNSMTASLAASRELQRQLIADAGHELRTPLTSLRTNIELLTRSEETGRPIPEADRRALLSSVKAQMSELAALIGDLQELSRPDPGQDARRVRILAWQDIVDSALRRARLRGPELTLDTDIRPWYVRAEPAALERAVVNVLDNAVKFSPPGGTIDVRLIDGVLTVRDRGPGVPAEELPHVFDRFWRSPSARSLPGSGLGLSIVARTVRQAGGEVALSPADDADGGTVATVRLPGAPQPPPTTAEVREADG
ncbi:MULTISPECIES: HAMP domain-containing sensor histidine kinase [unclassified Streptomyces]|uniref:HAMP domain-containing sensor histidine kinase n=1 Tax=unclassified Streptomyces TaxID=2593676 RepID=UPI00190472C2|nr:HAMP domain-containing sensor histidine kinase [Streptomyces sp. HSG2]